MFDLLWWHLNDVETVADPFFLNKYIKRNIDILMLCIVFPRMGLLIIKKILPDVSLWYKHALKIRHYRSTHEIVNVYFENKYLIGKSKDIHTN